ncbi:hypothetical protein CXX84_03580 [Arthrobacter sp. AFG7.2]|uniref:hypothetical protein n=1 Tax=Arthrobacter sp. AFG7.2 TaxID=1688693 RepID=UPI000C9EB4CA|nr:hypothetical protein [Arthrobacter sp. AFG7.2]PNI10542.1 hypothetical protein CXX84_03580 [Arthrobacter sp. AFG7.2]
MTLVKTNGTARAWTDRPTLLLLLAVLTTVFTFIAVLDGSRLVWAELLVVALVIAASWRAGAAGGIVVGLAGAAGHIALHSIDGGWGRDGAAFSVVAVCAFIVYGWLFGLTAAYLRRHRAAADQPPAAAGAGASQGLLSAAEGRALLDMEAEQARLAGDHLALVTVQMTVRDGILPKQAAHASRAVARTFEAAAAGRMHPVLLADNQLAMVIPGGDVLSAYRFEQAVLASLAEATFADRSAGTRPKASTALAVESAVVVLTESSAQAEALFSQPERHLDDARRRPAVPAAQAA